MSERPFKILGVQQIAIGSSDKNRLRNLWIDILGLPLIGNFKSESENVVEDIVMVGSGPFKVELDLMQPLNPERKPRVDIPPLNHIGLWVDDLSSAVTWLEDKGVRFTPGGIRKGASGYDVCFIHPKASENFPIGGEGVLIELVQAPKNLSEYYSYE